MRSINKLSEVNKGCKLAVSDAINWFFEHEEKGIRGDCLPNKDFRILFSL